MTVNPTRKEETMNAQRIEGAVALVTGANRGIGRALTEALLTRRVRKVYASAPTLARNGGGAVVNIGSLAGLTNFRRQFESSPKTSERQVAALATAMLSGSAA
jgi:NAD(P)-dependent dehydrogenase (short-subunit alcohol dehydrogenase family)